MTKAAPLPPLSHSTFSFTSPNYQIYMVFNTSHRQIYSSCFDVLPA